MTPSQLTGLILTLALLAGCTDRPRVDEDLGPDDPKAMKLPELSQEPLAPAVSMTQDYFHKSYPHLSAEAWKQKWVNSQISGLMFMRSFVNTWYDELGRVSALGPIGPCFGDAHPENFGFLPFDANGFEYTYNDLDDSGVCPVAFDALRYFTTLKLYLKDAALEAELRRSYVHFLNGENLPERPSRALKPDPGIALAKVLKASTKKGRIKLNATTLAVKPAKAQALFTAFKGVEGACDSCQLLDAAQVMISSGGSAGLERYWLLVQNGDATPQLVEFKQQVEPASERGGWATSKHLNRSAVMDDLWGKNWPQFYAFTSVDQKNYLLRTRVKADVELSDVSGDQRKSLLIEQVYLLAQLHKRTLSGSGILEEWLGRQSEFQAKRYAEALLAAKGG